MEMSEIGTREVLEKASGGTQEPVREGKRRLAYFVSHPIQYQAPLLRRIAAEHDIDLTVFFGSRHSIAGYADAGFGGVQVRWDVPLLEGYKSEFLPVIRPMTDLSLTTPANRGIFRALLRGRFDVAWIHGYWNVNSMAVMMWAKLLGIPVFVRTDSTLVDRPRSAMKLLAKRIFFALMKRFTTAVLTCSTPNAEYWRHYLGPSFPLFFMPYAVDNEYFRESALAAARDRNSFRETLGIHPDRVVILYASKMIARKRCIDLVEAYLGMRTGSVRPNTCLVIVGDGDERSKIEDRVHESGRTDVMFCGFQNQSQLARFYDLCDIFVLPSVDEPFALVINEVMNAGKAIVVSDEVGCQRDLVVDGDNGRVFKARDVEHLKEVLEYLVDNPEERHRMGRRSLEIIEQWGLEQNIEGLRKAIAFAVGGRVRGPENVVVRQ